MPLPKAILFDLDDTIITSDAISNECWTLATRAHAGKLVGIDPDRLNQELSSVRKWFWSDLNRNHTGRNNLDATRVEIVAKALRNLDQSDTCAAEIATSYGALMHERTAPFPGALETLRWFRSRAVKLGLITNGVSQHQRKKIQKFQLENVFDLILIEGEFGVGKPDPAIFVHALSTLGVAAGETWMVGDKIEFDIRAPKQLGIFTVWNDYQKAGLPLGIDALPDRIVHSIAELVT